MATITSISDDRGVIQGELSVGSRSDDDSLLLGGSANADETIRIYNGNALVAEIVADENGNWQYEASGLSEGGNEFSVSSIDIDGNESVRSSGFLVEVDQSVEAASGLGLSSTGGALDSGSTTTDGVMTLSGESEANASIEVFDDGVSVGTATADADGNWSLDLDLAVGEHNLTTQVTDDVGNESLESSAVNIEVEDPAVAQAQAAPQAVTASAASASAAPTATPDVVLPPGTTIVDGGFRNDDTPLIRGMATPHAEITLSVYGDTYGPVTAGADGIWSVQITNPLPQGTATFRAKATNAAGDAFFGYTLTIDSEASPAPTIDYANDDVGIIQDDLQHTDHTDDDAIKIHGTGTDGETIKLYDGTMYVGEAIVDSNGEWSYSLTNSLLEGVHVFTATSEDAAGNVSDTSSEFEITVDRSIAAPVITHAGDDVGSNTNDVLDGGKTDDSKPVIHGTAEANATVEVFQAGVSLGEVTADDNGFWELEISSDLAEGDYSFTTSQVDRAGNASGLSLDFDISVSLNADPDAMDDSYTVNRKSYFKVLKNDTDSDGDTVELTGIVSQGVHGTAVINSKGQVVYTPNANITSTVNDTIVYEISDGRGGVDTAEIHVTVLPGAAAPTLRLDTSSDSGVSNSDGITNVTSPILMGEATAGAEVILYDGSTRIASVTAKADGTWSHQLDNLADGTLDITATTQILGQRQSSDTLELTVDTVVEAGFVSAPAAVTNIDNLRFNLFAREEVSYEISDAPGYVASSGQISSDLELDPRTGLAVPLGTYSFNSIFTDIAGNVLSSDSSFRFFTPPPPAPRRYDPTAVLKDGGYVVTYAQQAEESANSFDIHAQRYNADGSLYGDSVLVNSVLLDEQVSADVIGLEDGGYVVTWQSYNQDGSDFGIFGQRFGADNETVGGEFQVNQYVNSSQERPEIASLNNGGFAVSWMSDMQDGDGQGVFIRLYDADGVALADEVQVNQTGELNQSNPTIGSLDNGNVVVTWENTNQDGTIELRASVISPSGEVVVPEFQIASTGAYFQLQPHVSSLSGGGFVVTWKSYEDGNIAHVLMQTFDESGLPISEQPILVSEDVGNARSEVASFDNGNVLVTWSDDEVVRYAIYPENGEQKLDEGVIAAPDGSFLTEPHPLALNDGGYLLTWVEVVKDTGDVSVVGQQFGSDGSPVNETFVVDYVNNPTAFIATPYAEVVDNAAADLDPNFGAAEEAAASVVPVEVITEGLNIDDLFDDRMAGVEGIGKDFESNALAPALNDMGGVFDAGASPDLDMLKGFNPDIDL